MKGANGSVLDQKGRVIHERDAAALSRGTRMMGADGEMINTIAALNGIQSKDHVDAARCRRFWVYKTEEERRVAAGNNHDCCAGSLLLIKVDLMNLTLARVVRQELNNATQPTLKLEPGSKLQTFKFELCVYEEVILTQYYRRASSPFKSLLSIQAWASDPSGISLYFRPRPLTPPVDALYFRPGPLDPSGISFLFQGWASHLLRYLLSISSVGVVPPPVSPVYFRPGPLIPSGANTSHI